MSIHRRHPSVVVSTVVVTDRFTISLIPSEPPINADLADQVRTKLGPLVKRLDLPRIHVMAEGRRVLLHGDVATDTDAAELEEATRAIEGVETVESHLHVGLLTSDTRPSQAEPTASEMLAALQRSAAALNLVGSPARAALWGALTAILGQIPPDERAHVLAHFPADVSAMVLPRVRLGDEGMHWRTELELDAAAALRGGISIDEAESLVPSVIAVMRAFVPEEDSDVRATLRTHLRELWERTDPAPPNIR
jgi:hypothetical protein